jgi:hypothetical protein
MIDAKPPPRRLVRALALLVIRTAWGIATVGAPLVAVVAALALLAAGH